MHVFSWFYRKEVIQFANELASKFAQAYPLEPNGKLSEGKKQKQLEKTIAKIKKELLQYRNDNKLSIYQKALLGKQFQKELFNLGYPSEFVAEATEEIILLIS